MRITVFLLLAFFLQTFANDSYSQKTKLSVQFSNTKLANALDEIEELSEFYFLYNEKLINTDREVSYSFENQKIEDILDQLFAGTDVVYTIADRKIILAPEFINDTKQTQISGKVTDESGQPLPGVTVVIKGTSQGVVTDIDGNYSITNIPDDAVLLFSFIGMISQEIEVGTQTKIDIQLKTDAIGVEEVVVIGYGTRQKKDLTGAVAQINSDVISKKPTLSAQAAMQGQLAGVFVSTTSSDPNARPTVRIRGVSTMGYNEPLYVIDGIPMTEGGTGSDVDSRTEFQRGNVNPLNMINPQDIESISVLKDASASAIYGLRASNGVILITTKRGSKDKMRINVSSTFTIQNLYKRYDAASMADYVSWSQEALDNRLKTDPGYKKDQYYSLFDPANPQYMGNSADYRKDWVDANLVKNALQQDHNISINGGNKVSNYAFGAGYATQEQATFYKNLKRYSVFANSDHNLAKWLKVGETIRLVYTETDEERGGDGLEAEFNVPWQPFYDATNQSGLPGLSQDRLSGSVPNPFDPNYVNSLNGYALPGRYLNNYSKNNNPLEFMSYGYGSATSSNFLGQADYRRKQIGMYRTLGGLYAEIIPFKGFRVKGSVNVDYYTQHNEEMLNPERGLFESNLGTYSVYESEGNTYRRRLTENFNIVKELLVGYNNQFGKHNIDLIFNASDQKYIWNITAQMMGQNSPIANWEQRRIDEGWSGLDKTTHYERQERGLMGYMGRLSYHFASKYYLDATVRRDGSSMFAPDYKWGTFPSFALAWRISEESFMKNIEWLDDLKIRFGWGQVGNQETRPYSYLSMVNFNPRTGFGSGGSALTPRPGDGIVTEAAVLGDFPVVDLTWETVTNTNVGIDAVLLENKLSVTADYYNRHTEGILQNFDLTYVVGALTNPKINLAEVRNSGVEFQVNYNDKFGDVGFYASMNLTTVKNEVLKLAYGMPTGGNNRIEEGYSMNYIYGYKTDGIFQNEAEVTEWKEKYTDSGYDTHKSPGDVRFVDLFGDYIEGESEAPDKDLNPDGKINDRDRTYLGKTIPGYFYGLTVGADYKNFDISLNFRGIGDVQAVDGRLLRSESGFGNNFDAAYADRWTPDNTSTEIPRFAQGDPSGNNRLSDRMVKSAAFLRLQDAQIGYNLQNDFLRKINVSKLRIYLAGSNLFVLHGLDELDPENNLLPTAFTFGLNVTF